jgi:hypothetical protein
LLTKAASYRRFLHASAMFEHTALDDRRIWSVNEYVSSRGNLFDISKIRIAALNAIWYTSNSS